MKKPQYDKGAPLKLEDLSPEQLQYLQESGMGKISTDPRYKDAQLAALQAMEERSKTGLTAQDEADMYKLQRNVSTQNRGRMGAIQNNMAVRGMSGSGMDALMQMQANQDATDREALSAMEKAGQVQNAKMNATQQLGQMGGQMRSQDFNEQSAKAQAQDAINRFNTSTRNDVFVRNNQTQNQGATQNWNRGNEVGDKNTEASYAHDLQQENERRIRDAEARRRKGATAGMVGGIIGGAAGSYAGPTGTAAGYGVGSQIGQTISGYAYGGDVQPNLDDPANDVVPAVLSPGEHVIPRSAMSSEQMFQDYTNRLKESIKARQGKVDDAESNVKNAQYGSIFANALNDFSKGNRKDTVLLNNVLKDPSGKPTVIQGEYNQIKDTWSEPANQELARQDKGLSQDKADFSQSEQMRNHFDDKAEKSQLKLDEASVDSPKAVQANLILKSVLSNKAKEAEAAGDKETANQLRSQIQGLKPLSAKDAVAQYDGLKNLDYKDVLANIAADKRLDAQLKSQADTVQRQDQRDDTKKQQLKVEMTNNLRKEVSGDALYRKAKETDMVLSQVDQIANRTNPTPQDDHALIMAFNKAMDPGSVVKESEFAMTAAGASAIGRLENLIKQYKTGERLSPQMRTDLVNTMKSIQNGNNIYLQNHVGKYRNAIASQGLDSAAIFGDEPSTAKPQPSTNQTINDLQLPGNWKEHK